MAIIFFLIPISLIVMGIGIWAFFWALKNNQYDDLEGPAHQILFDDQEEKERLNGTRRTFDQHN